MKRNGEERARPAIVALGYDRPSALARLLGSLERAAVPDGTTLVISIDGGGDPRVARAARAARWPFGPLEIEIRERNLGLRAHVLACGDLTERFGSIVMLEDDLFVSRGFYAFASQALARYADDPAIAGVSLYSHRIAIEARLPFWPIEDGNDVFFLQLPSSWGQAWTHGQWRRFRSWLDGGRPGLDFARLPPRVAAWPDSSWLRYFAAFTVATGSFVVYPRVSLTTNFNDRGTHVRRADQRFQVPLRLDGEEYRFRALEESAAAYDVFFELLPSRLRALCPALGDYDLDVDLYGTKRAGHLSAPWALTTRRCARIERGYGRELKPHELNVIHGVPGDAIRVVRADEIIREAPAFPRDVAQRRSDNAYFFRTAPGPDAATVAADALDLFRNAVRSLTASRRR
jgi:hypothetical protein